MYFGKRGYLAGAAVAGLILIAAGCGSDGSTASLTKAQFVKRGNAICKKNYEEIVRRYEEFARGGKENSTTDAGRNQAALRIVAPVLNKVVKGLRALGAPAGEEERIDEMLATFEEGIEKGEAEPAALRGFETEFALEPGYKKLWAYGLTECGLGT